MSQVAAFAGLSANTAFYNVTLGLAMLIGRYLVAVPVLAIAGSMVAKPRVPASSGTLPTEHAIFVGLLVGTIVVVGILTYFPAWRSARSSSNFWSDSDNSSKQN